MKYKVLKFMTRNDAEKYAFVHVDVDGFDKAEIDRTIELGCFFVKLKQYTTSSLDCFIWCTDGAWHDFFSCEF